MDDIEWAIEVPMLTSLRMQHIADEMIGYCDEETDIGLRLISILIELGDKLEKGRELKAKREMRKRLEEGDE